MAAPPPMRSTSCCPRCLATAFRGRRQSSGGARAARPPRRRRRGPDAPLCAAQGGDVGALVSDTMGRQAPDGLLGIHLNLLAGAPFIVDHLPKTSEQGRAAPAALAPFTTDGFGYFQEQVTRPQTIGYSLLDSPVGLAAWMLDHDTDSDNKSYRVFVGGPR